MRKIKRNKGPDILLKKDVDFREKLSKTSDIDTTKEWENFAEKGLVRGSLIEMYNNKCCFCEVDIKGSTPAIEHFKPKCRFKHLCFKYDNLHLICSSCNSSKGKKYEDDLLSPTEDVPEYSLDCNSIFNLVPKDGRGEKTLSLITNLNSDTLIHSRAAKADMIQRIVSNVDRWLATPQNSARDIEENLRLLKEMMEPGSEYSLMCLNLFKEQVVILEKKWKDMKASVSSGSV